MMQWAARGGFLAGVLITGGCQFRADSDLPSAEARTPLADLVTTYAELARRLHADTVDATRVLRHAV